MAIGLLITIISGIGIATNAFSGLNKRFADSLYTRNEPSEDIVIIAIDENSTQPKPQGLGRYSQWSRENYTQLLDILKEEQPKTITFDILFNKPTETIALEKISVFQNSLDENLSADGELESYKNFFQNYSNPLKNIVDQDFAAKLEEAKNVILVFSSNLASNSGPIFPLKKFSQSATLGDAFSQADNDGILRKVQPFFKNKEDEKIYPDMALASVMKYLDAAEIQPADLTENSLTITGKNQKTIKLPLENSQLNVNYFADPFGYKMISFSDVHNEKFTKGTFKNKIVLVGVTSFKDAEDRVLTPKSNNTPMSGVEFRANEIQTILDGKFLRNQSTGATILTIAAITIGLAIALNYLAILFSILAAVTAIIIYLISAHLLYKNGLILNMVYPFVAIIFAYLASWIYKYFIADRKKRELKSAFGHYVNQELVDQISKNPDMVKLGGEKKVVTVFFSDIKDSTAHSEKTPIELWISQMNEYFTVMSNVLKRSGGTLDKYEGDAVMGFWNAPVSQQDHVLRAYACALGMRKALISLHEKWAKEGKPLIEFRIGINTGEALVGNFGSADQFNFTVMGDMVNTASRLESAANKAYGTKMIVAGFENITGLESARANLSPGTTSQSSQSAITQNFTLRELDIVYLPGKKEPVKLFELLGLASETTEEIQNLLKFYSQGLAAYRCKDFATAIKNFQLIPNDKPSQILLSRCQKLHEGEKIAEMDEQMIFRIQNK